MTDPQLPLDSHSCRSSRETNPVLSVFAMLFGFLCGAILTILLGVAVSSMADAAHGGIDFLYWPGVICFAFVAVLGFGGFVYSLMATRRHAFIAGLLLGAAIMALLEGACFFSYSPI